MLDRIRSNYFYVLLINITFSANGWNLLGLSLGQLLYWYLLFLGFLIFLKSSYLKIGYILLFATVILKGINLLLVLPWIEFIGDVSSGLFFILVGSILYGKNLTILYKQLLYFFALSIPFMILQKIGCHTFFYGWSTELFHENGTYSFDEVRDLGVIFKNIPLYPTLFVDFEDLTYVMYQGRPTGLLYSNNVLSVILSLFLALHFSISSTIIRKSRNIIVISLIISLIMSTLVFGVLILLFVYFYFVNKNKILNMNALKTFSFTVLMLILHYLFFPGLTLSSLGLHNAVSFVSRFDQIFQAFGVDYFQDFKVLNNLDLKDDESYSLIGSLVKNDSFYIFIFLFLVLLVVYNRNVKKMKGQELVYVTVFIVCILTQFGVNFLRAPSFQIFLGIAFYPFMKSHVSKSSKQMFLSKLQ
jgi:hypothetical protein